MTRLLSNLSELGKYRVLIQSLVARELKARYRGSVLGFLWSFINPLLLLTIYSFVFSVVLPGTRPASIEPYALFMFCGILPWTWFSSSSVESANVLMTQGNLIKKVLFPAEVLPVVVVTSNLINFLYALPILVAAKAVIAMFVPNAPSFTPYLLQLPIVMIVQCVFSLGFGFLLAALTVHFRDIKDILGNLLTFWFFATPIVYTRELAANSPLLRTVLDLNPNDPKLVSAGGQAGTAGDSLAHPAGTSGAGGG